MARKIEEIKNGIETDFMNNAEAAEAYGFEVGDNFGSHFSTLSIESILFYVFACAAWFLEVLFEQHQQEVETKISTLVTPRLKWYRDKTLLFMKGYALIPDTDTYDTTEMTADDIEAARVVKHAIAVESKDQSLVTIKVKGADGALDEETREQLEAYIHEFRPAGVRTVLVSTDGDRFNCVVNVQHDPLVLGEEVREACRNAIIDYIQNLPFNGEYSNMSLIDTVQNVAGVKIADFVGATYQPANAVLPMTITSRCQPEAGWFTPGDITVNIEVYE